MKTMKAKDLKKILIEANRLIGNGEKTLPILDYLLVNEGRLIVTNLQTWLIWKVPFKGTFVCPVKELKGILTTCKAGDEVYLTHDKKTNKVEVEINGFTSFKMGDETDQAMDFPKTPQLSDKTLDILSVEDVKHFKTLNQFRSTDELRPALNAIMMGKNIMVATNGHQLVWYDIRGVFNSKKDQFLIDGFIGGFMPLEPCEISQPEKSNLENYHGKYVAITFKSKEIVTRLIDERYPDYKNVIPTAEMLPITAVIDRATIIREVTNALAMSNKTTHQIRLLFTAEGKTGNVLISSEDLDFNYEYRHEISVNIDGEPFKETNIPVDDKGVAVKVEKTDKVIEIGFNGNLLLELIKLSDANLCFFAMSAPNRATIIDGNALLMPVMLNNYV